MIKILKAAVLAASVLLYYELRKVLSGNTRKTRAAYAYLLIKNRASCNKLLFTYALSLFTGARNAEMLLSLVPYIDKSFSAKKGNNMAALKLAEAALWEADIDSYAKIKKHIAPELMKNKRLVDYANVLDGYYLWLIGKSDPPSLDGIFEGFFLFRAQLALMKAVFSLQQQDIGEFRRNITVAAHEQVSGSQTSRKLKENAEKFSETVPTLDDVRHVLIEAHSSPA